MHIYSYPTQIFTINISIFAENWFTLSPSFIHISLMNLLVSKTWIFLCPIWYKLMWIEYTCCFWPFQSHHHHNVVFGVPERESHHHHHKMLSLGYVEFTSWIGFYRWLTPPSHFGDRTHVTYSYGLDCEKQEHWNRARNHYTVYLASLR